MIEVEYSVPAITGEKIGRNTSTMAGHSKGQPSRKIRPSTSTSITNGGSGSATIASVIQFAVPMRANTAPKTFEVTASSSTMLEVVIVRDAAPASARRGEPAVGERQDERAERPDARRLGRRGEAGEDRAERERR